MSGPQGKAPMLAEQLVLDIRQPLQMDFASFYVGERNRLLVSRLQALAAGQAGQVCYVWGATGSGKSHLLQAVCAAACDHGLSALYLESGQLRELPPEVLDQLEDYTLVALDDVELLTCDMAWQEALFHFYNRLLSARHSLVISARLAPAQLQLTLADLQSRLLAGEVYALHELADGEQGEYLQHAARRRGFVLDAGVVDYLLSRVHRDLATLGQLIDTLDQLSLSQQRQVTVPFVKQVLGLGNS